VIRHHRGVEALERVPFGDLEIAGAEAEIVLVACGGRRVVTDSLGLQPTRVESRSTGVSKRRIVDLIT
jgi:hypothetical protein